MLLSNSAAVPPTQKDNERSQAPSPEREINSSDMEIDDEEYDEEGKEDLQGSSNRNDAGNIMESKGHDGQLGSDSSSLGKLETRMPSKTFHVGESCANFKFSSLAVDPSTTQREDLCKNYEAFLYPTSGKQPAKQKATQEYAVSVKVDRVTLDRKAPEDHHEQQINSKSNPINDSISTPVGYQSGGVNDLGFEEKIKQMDVQTEDDKRRIKSRSASAAPQTSAGSLSPGADFSSGNKRPALICDFFARGWCIKGSSCRFLHVKDSVNNPGLQPEEDVAEVDRKRADQLDEGFKNAAEISKSPGSTDTLHQSVGNKAALSSHFFSEGIVPLGNDENQRLHPLHEINKFHLLHSKDKSMGTYSVSQRFSASTDDLGPSKDVRQNAIAQNLPANSYAKPASLNDGGSSTFSHNFLPEYVSSLSGSVTSLSNIYNENQSYRVSTSLASWPLSSSSACSLGAQKMSENDRERCSSRLFSLQGFPPFSGSGPPENFPLNDIAKDPLHFAQYRIQIPSDDWEPSVPFRPSFFVTYGISSPRSQYDPLRDSIDFSNAGERSLKFSFSSQGPSLPNVAYPPTYGDSTSTGPLVPECNGDKKTASCHNRYHGNLANNNCYASGKDSLTTDANDGTSAADLQNGTLAKEEISSVASHVRDTSKTDKIDTDHNVREKDETSDEHKADRDELKESKAMRHIRAALIDLIKELLKPTWREGHLSKDAHNKIVKKAVDKVLGTIQPHQIASTSESVKQYLSSSQPKIARLVEAYIEKYGKS